MITLFARSHALRIKLRRAGYGLGGAADFAYAPHVRHSCDGSDRRGHASPIGLQPCDVLHYFSRTTLDSLETLADRYQS
jgi:hypothetical protein